MPSAYESGSSAAKLAFLSPGLAANLSALGADLVNLGRMDRGHSSMPAGSDIGAGAVGAAFAAPQGNKLRHAAGAFVGGAGGGLTGQLAGRGIGALLLAVSERHLGTPEGAAAVIAAAHLVERLGYTLGRNKGFTMGSEWAAHHNPANPKDHEQHQFVPDRDAGDDVPR